LGQCQVTNFALVATEVTYHAGKQLTPHGVGIENPAFDVTPAKYVTAIITERGVLRSPTKSRWLSWNSLPHKANSAAAIEVVRGSGLELSIS
jgi:hypothetical protein